MFFAILIISIVFLGFLFVAGSAMGTSLFCAIKKGKKESKKEAKEILEGIRPVPEKQKLNQLIDSIKSQSVQEDDRDLVEDLRNLKKGNIEQTENPEDEEDEIVEKQSSGIMHQWKIKLNKGILFKKSPGEIKFLQKFKDFYSNKVNSSPKKICFWIFVVTFFILLLPFCLGGILASYISPRIETKPSWLKLGIIALILIMTLQIGTGWTKDLLGMNIPPNIVINNPMTEETKVKGVSVIEIFGKVDPAGSIIEINSGIVTVTDEGDFVKKVSISKGKNEIDIIGKHGSGITEKTIIVYRELTEEEIAEEKIKEEERKARAEEKRIAREEAEEAKKKAEVERKAELETKIDFKITTEKIYSNYLRCQKDSSFEDIIHKKYNGKIVEIIGIVEYTRDLYKDTDAAKQGADISKFIDKDERYVVCLADGDGHACVAWVYSSSSQLINNIKVGDKISVIGRWADFEGLGSVPDLMDSEIKEIY